MSVRCTLDQNIPRNSFLLNGRWQVTGGTEETLPSVYSSTVPVPALVDMAEPPYEWQNFEFHYYRTTFVLEQLSPAASVFLKIAQSMFGTEVWLNGHHIGGSISCYTSHEYLLNDHLDLRGENELVVRVGAKGTLPPESAVGRDQEKEIFIPGIWGDVTLTCLGGARVQLVQVIPHIERSTAEVRVWIENLDYKREALLVSVRLFEKRSGEPVSPIADTRMMLHDRETKRAEFELPLDSMNLWSPDRPFLYEAEVTIEEGQTIHDSHRTIFGMREFAVRGADFYLNGKKILLRGSNIAFHRFLSDQQRKLLPWNKEWIKKAFIDIPKDHHFNFFRNHLGQMYNAWYDIADEYGMLIQNEWQFWCATGTDVQIRKEFTDWLHDNWNHPSIIIWDPINEASDDTVQTEIVAEMKELDPTRPWESVDFLEEHPYIYSLGMVLNNRRFGFARSLNEIENLPVPSMLNEFLWWWFNDLWEPTVLTKMIVQRWMGRTYTKEDVIAHQSFLAQELIEQFRRMRVKAIQPFVYISNNDGPTAHWFLGDIQDLQPKPLMKAIKSAFAPFAVSIELWDRHFIVKKEYSVRVFVFNDSPFPRSGVLKFGVLSSDNQWIEEKDIPVTIPPTSDAVFTEQFVLPNALDEWSVTAQLTENNTIVSKCKKITHAIHPPVVPTLRNPVGLFDPSGEIETYLRTTAVTFESMPQWDLTRISTVIINGNVLGSRLYAQQREALTKFVNDGGTLILIEPEFRVVGNAVHTVIAGIDLTITQRSDADKGGYDSYVFAESQTHPLWRSVPKEYLKLFNGAYGGEIVSQYDVSFSVPSERLASCGMDLAVIAAAEAKAGKGKIILFRLQLRGRLIDKGTKDSLYARRVDPVAQQLLMNLLEYGERNIVSGERIMMKLLIMFTALIILNGCGTMKEWTNSTGQHPQHIETQLVKTVSYDLLVYTPKGVRDEKKLWPMIIFLHGSGERGNDPNRLKVHSLPKVIDREENFPFIVVSPQCPDGKRWNAESLNAMLDEVLTKLPVDTNRIYLTGLSMGGYGTWKFAIAYPERFAAVAPVCGWGHLEDVEKLKQTPVWIFHGAKDDVVPPSESEKMVKFLEKFGSTKVKFTLYPNANHNAWDATYSNQELYDWFLQHSKR